MNLINEINRIEQLLNNSVNTLNNTKFIKNAPQRIIDKEKQKVEDFSSLLNSLYEQRHLEAERIKARIYNKYGNERWIEWLIQYERGWNRILSLDDLYTKEWFEEVYADYTDEDILYIANKMNL